MTTSEELARLLQQAISDKSAEPAFFRALLDASVYAHVPRSGHKDRLRLIQFTTPAGLRVLPFFSDEIQAKAAAGSAATVVVMTGRQLLGLTRGATLMLNPNETSCVLYPEEISALLDHGRIGIVECIDTGEQELWIAPTKVKPAKLVDRLVATFAKLGTIHSAYIAEVRTAHEAKEYKLLIAAAVLPKDVERAVRATTAEIQVHCAELEAIVDFTTFEPGSPPNWLKEARLQPFYVLAIGFGGLH